MASTAPVKAAGHSGRGRKPLGDDDALQRMLTEPYTGSDAEDVTDAVKTRCE
jgi:hypothetical protein